MAGHASCLSLLLPVITLSAALGVASTFKRPFGCGTMSLSQSNHGCQTLKECSTLLFVVVSTQAWRRPSFTPVISWQKLLFSPPPVSGLQGGFCQIRTQSHRPLFILVQDRVRSPKRLCTIPFCYRCNKDYCWIRNRFLLIEQSLITHTHTPR